MKLRLVTSIHFGITLTTSLEGHWCERCYQAASWITSGEVRRTRAEGKKAKEWDKGV